MADPVIQNALQLRHFADAASGLRGADRYVFADGRASITTDPLAVPSDLSPAPIMELDTRFQQPLRAVPEVTIRTKEMQEAKVLEKYDAVFWSEASVEKFVLPYYASKSYWMAAHVLAVLSRYWYGFVPVVVNPPEGDPLPADAIPFALAHLPTSDYVMLEGDEIGSDLHLLYHKEDGSVLARSLAELLRAERGAEGQNG